jgi:dCMP deaminase
MQMAELTATLSYAKRLQVGALIVKGNRIVGTGYNGMPTDWEKVAQSTESSEGSTMFCTHAPCVDCAKLIYQSGIATLYFKHEYRDDAGIKFLKLSGVNVHNHVQL